MEQLHKKLQDHQVNELICRYLGREIERSYIEEILGIGKARFFALVKKFNEDPDSFSIEYKRKGPSRKISFNSLVINITGVPIRDRVGLRIVPDFRSGMAEIRFWFKNELVGTYQVKNEDLNLPNF